MKRLDGKNLHRPFKHGDVVSDHKLIQWQVILDLPFIVSVQHDSTSTGVEWCKDGVFGQVNHQLNQLFVNFAYRTWIALLEKCLKGEWHVIVVDIDVSILVVLKVSEVDDIFVVNVF